MDLAKRYTYRVEWYEPDEMYVGLCLEMPSLSHLAEDIPAAVKGIAELVSDILENWDDENDPPLPLSLRRSYRVDHPAWP